jgi:hypothetical protein
MRPSFFGGLHHSLAFFITNLYRIRNPGAIRFKDASRALFFSVSLISWDFLFFWSGKRDSNSRLRPWQGRTLPLSYSRSPAVQRKILPQIIWIASTDYTNFLKSFSRQIYRIVGDNLRLKSVAEKRGFFANHRNNIKPVRVLPEIIIGDEFLGSTTQDLLLLPVHKFPWFAKLR